MIKIGALTRSSKKRVTGQGRSFQPLFQIRRIPRPVENRQHRECIVPDGKVNGVSFESFQSNLPCPATHLAKSRGLVLSLLQGLINLLGKSFSQPRPFLLVPGNRGCEFRPCGWLKNKNLAPHQPKRCRISALICSKGIPARGSFSKSASRWSNSVACSGVNSTSTPPSPAQTFSAMSYCSAGGNRRICSKISDALMSLIYRVKASVQAAFLACRLSFAHTNPPATA